MLQIKKTLQILIWMLPEIDSNLNVSSQKFWLMLKSHISQAYPYVLSLNFGCDRLAAVTCVILLCFWWKRIRAKSTKAQEIQNSTKHFNEQNARSDGKSPASTSLDTIHTTTPSESNHMTPSNRGDTPIFGAAFKSSVLRPSLTGPWADHSRQ